MEVARCAQYCIQHLVSVTLDSGVVGWGEGSEYAGQTSDETLASVVGKRAAELMWDDSIGTNLQMALFDAVGKELGVPVHQLLPNAQVRDWVALSWWCHSNAPSEWAEEARLATAAGCEYHRVNPLPIAACCLLPRPWSRSPLSAPDPRRWRRQTPPASTRRGRGGTSSSR